MTHHFFKNQSDSIFQQNFRHLLTLNTESTSLFLHRMTSCVLRPSPFFKGHTGRKFITVQQKSNQTKKFPTQPQLREFRRGISVNMKSHVVLLTPCYRSQEPQIHEKWVPNCRKRIKCKAKVRYVSKRHLPDHYQYHHQTVHQLKLHVGNTD